MLKQFNKDIKKFFKSFGYAFEGIKEALKQRNMKLHVLASLLVIIAGVIFEINITEWLFIIISVFTVFSAEMFNTAIEEICDRLRDDHGATYHATKRARDIASGAVLFIAISALIIGLIIFIPKVLNLLVKI